MIQINRPTYLQFLTDWKDEHVIKVVSGVRRCGKSTLFEMFKNHLIEDGIDEKTFLDLDTKTNMIKKKLYSLGQKLKV